MKFLAAILLFACLTQRAHSMDHIEALSQIESNDRDTAIGADGEISRYQILPAVWKANWARRWNPTGKLLIGDPTDEFNARLVVFVIMEQRVDHFIRAYHREPTDTEWYLLWHRPARVMHPRPAEADRAQRFANLCSLP